MRKQDARAAEAVRDYIVIVSIGGGGGSWARGADRDQTIERCKRILKSDWKSLFDFKRGTVIKANVLDVTGFDQVEWDDRGVRVDGQPFAGKVELVDMRF
jgi:hypothetical protein